MSDEAGISVLERLEAILRNPATYELARTVPEPARRGRPRQYPPYMLIVYEALLSVFGSARQVDAELGHLMIWGFIRKVVGELFPNDPTMALPAAPMRRHHYLYGRKRCLADPGFLAELGAQHRRLAAMYAADVGLMDPNCGDSWTNPDLGRMLYADGKVVAPLFKHASDDRRVVPGTGEIVPRRFEPDAGLHFEGDGNTAFGVKFVIAAARLPERHGRIVLDVDWVPSPGGEAKTAMDCFRRLSTLLPAARGVIYDTALRGVHHQELLRELGLLPINKVTAAKAGTRKPRRGEGRRQEKSVHVEDKKVTLPEGRTVTIRLYAFGGAIGIGEVTDKGDLRFVPLRRKRTHRNADKSGRFRWYNDYELPEGYGGGSISVRLHANDEDRARKFNRTENVRPIPPADPLFRDLYRRRNDAESINRNLDDTMWLGRAHSVGHERQLLNMLGYALAVNSLTLSRHSRERLRPAA